MRWFWRLAARHHSGLTGVLVLTIALLGAAIILKYFPKLTLAEFSAATISAFSALLTATIVAIGAGYSYFRFFRGRTFTLKIELEVEVQIARVNRGASLLHTVLFKVRNVGASTLWFPTAVVFVKPYGGEVMRREITMWWPDQVERKPHVLEIIEAGESQTFALFEVYESSIEAVSYYCSCRSDSDEWYTAKTVENRISDGSP